MVLCEMPDPKRYVNIGVDRSYFPELRSAKLEWQAEIGDTLSWSEFFRILLDKDPNTGIRRNELPSTLAGQTLTIDETHLLASFRDTPHHLQNLLLAIVDKAAEQPLAQQNTAPVSPRENQMSGDDRRVNKIK